MFKSLVSTRPYEPTVDEYPRSWCGKDSSYYSHLFPLFEAIYSPYCFCGWNSMKLSPMGSKFQSCWIAIFPVSFGPGWTRWKYLRFWMDGQPTRWHHITAPYVATSYQHQPKFTNYCKYLQIGSLKIVSRNLRNTSLRLHSHQWALQEGSLGMRRRTPGFRCKNNELGGDVRNHQSEVHGVHWCDFFWIALIFFFSVWETPSLNP